MTSRFVSILLISWYSNVQSRQLPPLVLVGLLISLQVAMLSLWHQWVQDRPVENYFLSS